MDYYGFTSASILLQGNADRFSSMAPAERKEFLAEILGLSICDEIARIARAKTREINSDISARGDELGRLDTDLISLKSAPTELEAARKEKDAAQKSENEAKKALESVRERKEK